MHCPNDGTALQMTSRSGIEIDYCPKCRGVWLDRGELDKLIERSADSYKGPESEEDEHYGNQSAPRQSYREDDDNDEHYGRQDHRGDQHRKKKEGFLGDLFDF